MVAVKDSIAKVWLVLNSYIPKSCSEFFEGKLGDLVVQVQSISTVRTNRFEGDSCGADSKKSSSSWDTLVGRMCRELGMI
jgi:hypothetical protein